MPFPSRVIHIPGDKRVRMSPSTIWGSDLLLEQVSPTDYALTSANREGPVLFLPIDLIEKIAYHVITNLTQNPRVCPSCGSPQIDGTAYKVQGEVEEDGQCQTCGKWYNRIWVPLSITIAEE